MQYFFELGNNPALSIAEIFSILGARENYQIINNKILIIESETELEAEKLIQQMGGVIKIGKIILEKVEKINLENLSEYLEKQTEAKSKIFFGFSYYGNKKINLKPLGMEVKKYFKQKGLTSRWVNSKENILSSVVVEQNNLLKKGFELAVIEDKENFLIGETTAVQPFKELSFRDYGRPARDDRSGMLPPKLAQIMINLALAPFENKEDAVLFDPFCGSGTLITEACLSGIKNIIGTDISSKAVLDAKKNINWAIKSKEKNNARIFECDIKKITDKIQEKSIDAIATEPYLGPQRGRIDIKKVIKDLESLYSTAFARFNKILKPKRRIVIIFPVFNLGRNKKVFINPNFAQFKTVSPLPEKLLGKYKNILSKRGAIIYGRQGQRVWREILVLE
ncbi:methyltransferase domain-containing protein [Candidatus Parcubacteria bacterium]|nr:methyltransferase domain-containing protein [Candidatus Parcubacteria bacterium]